MRRLADRDAADVRLREGRLGRDALRALAEKLARFHAGARCDAQTARYGSLEAIEANVRENFEQTRSTAPEFLSRRELSAIESWQVGFLREHRARFAERVARGRVRDGHGDLRLEHCYLDDAGAIEVIDCIEFNERFRFGDVCADIAFLAMDLSWHERPDLAEQLLADYARASGDYDLYGVVDFYESYRAFVRGKVCTLLLAEPDVAPEVRARAERDARKYLLLSEACTRQPLSPPAVYAVGGVIASGKSTVAGALGDHLAAPVISSDVTRKKLAGVDPLSPLPDSAYSGHYDEQATAATYAELLRRAEVALRSQRSVVLDASFRTRGQRHAALELARRCGTPFFFVECVVPEAVSRARLAERARDRSISDGREEVFDAFVETYEPVRDLPARSHLRLSTDGPPRETLARVLSWCASA
jgi:predicted kinase